MKKWSMVSLLSLIAISATLGNVLFAVTSAAASVMLHFVSAFLISVVIFKSYADPAQRNKWDAVDNNISEAQRILREKPYGIFKYASRKTVFGYEAAPATSITQIVEEPLVWFFCIALYAAVFFTPTYFEFDIADKQKIMKLTLFTLIQLMLLTTAIFGVITTVSRKFRGDKK